MLVTVAAFHEPYEAHLFRGRLEAEGIVAFVSHEMHVANKWYLSNALGGAKVQVSSDEFELAREVERAACRGDYRELLGREIGDLDDAVCPYCGGRKFRKRRPLPRAALAICVSLTLALVAPPTGWILRCEACRREYRAPHRRFSRRKAVLVAALMAVVVLTEIALVHWIHKAFGCTYGPSCF